MKAFHHNTGVSSIPWSSSEYIIDCINESHQPDDVSLYLYNTDTFRRLSVITVWNVYTSFFTSCSGLRLCVHSVAFKVWFGCMSINLDYYVWHNTAPAPFWSLLLQEERSSTLDHPPWSMIFYLLWCTGLWVIAIKACWSAFNPNVLRDIQLPTIHCADANPETLWTFCPAQEQTEMVEHTLEMKGICLIKDLLIYNTTLYNVEHIAI